MSRMGRLVCGVAVLALVSGFGCASDRATGFFYPNSKMENLTLTQREHFHRISMIAEQDRRSLADDLDVFFLTERPSRLNRWQSR